MLPDRGQIIINPELFALLLAGMRQPPYQIALYDTQIFTCLALLYSLDDFQGRVGGVQTGEGTSKIRAMTMAYIALFGYYVDVVITSDYLAQRDTEEYRLFYQTLGIESLIKYATPTQSTEGEVRMSFYRKHLKKRVVYFKYLVFIP